MWQWPGPIDPNPDVYKVEGEYRAKRGWTRSNNIVVLAVELVWLLLVGVFKVLRSLVRLPLRWLRRSA